MRWSSTAKRWPAAEGSPDRARKSRTFRTNRTPGTFRTYESQNGTRSPVEGTCSLTQSSAAVVSVAWSSGIDQSISTA